MLALCRLSRALVPGGRTLRLACAPALKPMLTVGVGFTTFNAITSQAFCIPLAKCMQSCARREIS